VEAPTAAERIRSVMSGSGSLSLTTGGHCYDLIAMHTVDAKGQLRLHVPADSPLAAEAVCAPRGVLGGLVQFTDIAPTSVRDRVRARIALSGRLTPADIQSSPDVLVLRLEVARAAIEADGAAEEVRLDDLAHAQPDPLARDEAALLGHLDHDHQDVVVRLSRLAGPEVLQGVVRVRPLALDRYGFTLRCEYARDHHDFRVVSPTPVRDQAEIGKQVELLLSRAARGCPHRRRADRS
jgi:hypothetical protein